MIREQTGQRLRRLFTREVGNEQHAFQQSGYALLRGFVDRDFLDYCDDVLASLQSDAVPQRQIEGKKTQFVLEWPAVPGLRDELFATAANLLQCRKDQIVISERHLHVYLADAPAQPLPHKDRAASQIAIGIPLQTSDRSELILFPDAGTANALDNAIGLRRALGGSDFLVEEFMARTPRVRLQARRGDAVAFLGSRLFHERYHAANTVVVYLKLNNFGSDPLNENLIPECDRSDS